MPVFLEVAQVIAGYQLQSTIGGTFTTGNFNAALIGPLTASGTATASGTYTDRPTVVYSPLTGVDFLKRLMTPIPPSSVMFMLQAGYAAQRVMPIMLDLINGIANGSNRLQRPPDPRFIQLVKLVGEAQQAGTIEIRIERTKQGSELTGRLCSRRTRTPPAIARRGEITRLLGLRPDLRELKIEYGAYSGRNDEIDMKTRSMLEIMLEFAAGGAGPGLGYPEGKAAPGAVSSQPQATWAARRCGSSSDTAPKDVFVAVPLWRPMVLDCRQRYSVQDDVRHRHATVFDRRYRHQGSRTRCHDPANQ